MTEKVITAGRLHAEWCGHCVSLAPKWDKMLENINEGVKGGKYREPKIVDLESKKISAGELDKYNLENKEYLGGKNVVFSGFPTLFKVENKQIEYYGGKREVDDMEKWFMANNHNSSKNENRGILQKYNSDLKHKSASLNSVHRRRHSFSMGGRTRRYKKTRRNRHNKTRKNRHNKK